MPSNQGAPDEARAADPGGRVDPVSLLRQPPEVPGLRQHVQREGRHRGPLRRRVDAAAADASRASPLRRRHGRRDRPLARAPDGAPPLPDRARARGGEGDQPRGRPPGVGEDAGPLRRAPPHGARRHEPVLRRRARAPAERPGEGRDAELAGGAPRRRIRARARRADRGARAHPRFRLGDEPESGDRQSGAAAAVGPGALPPRPRVPARRRHRPGPTARHVVRLRARVATVAGAHGRRVQGREDPGAADPEPGARAAASWRSSHGVAIRAPRSSSGSGPARGRSPSTGTP